MPDNAMSAMRWILRVQAWLRMWLLRRHLRTIKWELICSFYTDVDHKAYFLVEVYKSTSERFGTRYKVDIQNEATLSNLLRKCYFKLPTEQAILKKTLHIKLDKEYKMTNFEFTGVKGSLSMQV